MRKNKGNQYTEKMVFVENHVNTKQDEKEEKKESHIRATQRCKEVGFRNTDERSKTSMVVKNGIDELVEAIDDGALSAYLIL